jgi:hypothetical protein
MRLALKAVLCAAAVTVGAGAVLAVFFAYVFHLVGSES